MFENSFELGYLIYGSGTAYNHAGGPGKVWTNNNNVPASWYDGFVRALLQCHICVWFTNITGYRIVSLHYTPYAAVVLKKRAEGPFFLFTAFVVPHHSSRILFNLFFAVPGILIVTVEIKLRV